MESIVLIAKTTSGSRYSLFSDGILFVERVQEGTNMSTGHSEFVCTDWRIVQVNSRSMKVYFQTEENGTKYGIMTSIIKSINIKETDQA